MNRSKFLQPAIGMLWGIVFLAGCVALTAAATPTLSPPFPPPTPTSSVTTCPEINYSPLGVLRSTDHGATWASLGNACLWGSSVWAVDPTPLIVDGRLALYFVDFNHLEQGILYRAISEDGLNFETTQPVFTYPEGKIVDPFVLHMPNGLYRLYVPAPEGIISAVSSNGLAFKLEPGVRITYGGMPGALLRGPLGRGVRMFLNGDIASQTGIFSMTSNDGLNFNVENGWRILVPPNFKAIDPEPIQLADGSYLMLWGFYDRKYEQPGVPPWDYSEMHLATSPDGFNWTPNPNVIGYGGTSCVVEMPDGTLFIYYVNR